MNRQPGAFAVINKAQLPELIHEMTDPRPGCADHLCQTILTDSGEHRFGAAFLAKMSEQQKDPGHDDARAPGRPRSRGAPASVILRL